MKEYSFKKHERLKKSKEYNALSKHGKRYHEADFIIIYKKNNELNNRLGITVSKKVGNAVKRNRIKRIIREYFRNNKILLPLKLDINIIAKKTARSIDSIEIGKQISRCLMSIGNSNNRKQ
ncbi:ribonuclease P protein component [Desulfosarcina ovata subsp. sediminis]|uniref:Ribonuclease P protein component n=1 Tax=Desulfosarcina ovata subsp. sediminis TaxID=885957 RepID=A0A5K7ZUT6_9BACT|nr:ribonuclease P protein component [Desulfosarcina ovata]BBO84005.1 ribonuclease P protein component [Desulfosarcina ovata subsp. sediminis]